jgi:hypothetical protein
MEMLYADRRARRHGRNQTELAKKGRVLLESATPLVFCELLLEIARMTTAKYKKMNMQDLSIL